jgi:hypothetical protein
MNVRLVIRAIRNANTRSAANERDILRIADALNQYAMQVEDVAFRELQGSVDRLDHEKAQRRYREKHIAARKLRDQMALIIARLDP